MIRRSSLCATTPGFAAFLSPLLLAGCWISALEQDPVAARDCEARTAYFRDVDLDGLGDNLDVILGCSAPDGYVESGGDCDDQDPTRGLDCGDSGPDSGPDTGADTGADSGPAAPERPT